MNSRLLHDAWRMLMPVLFAVLLVHLSGSLWPMIGILALLLAWQVWQKWRLARWLARGQLLDPPHASGLWEDYYTRLMHLFRYEQRAQQSLANILERARFAADAIDEALVLIEADYRLVYFNRVACQLLDLNEEDQGENITNLVRDPNFKDYLEKRDFKNKIVLRDSLKHYVLQIQVVDLKQQGLLLRILDISRIEQLENLKKDFVANVSHELKTPITVFRGALELFTDIPDLPEVKKQDLLHAMGQQSLRMQQLVNDLLLLAQMEGKTKKALERVDLSSLWQRLEANFCLKTANKQQTLIWQVEPNLAVLGIEQELESVFSNLLDNAVKYTPEGGQITFSAYQAAGEVQVSVKDNGIGIAPVHINHLTERFYRVDKDRNRDTGGTGLGLSIVKHILQHHHAQLKISSQPQQGSLFACIFKAVQ